MATDGSAAWPNTVWTIWRPSSSPAARSGTLMQRGLSALHWHEVYHPLRPSNLHSSYLTR